IRLTLTNTGERAGDEVVQLYLRDVVASLTRPVKTLQGFRRVSLAAGEKCTLTFTVAAAQMAFYDQQMQYCVEPGEIQVMVGSSSEDIRLTGQVTITGSTAPVARKVFLGDSTVD